MRRNDNTEFYYERLKKIPKNIEWFKSLVSNLEKAKAFGKKSINFINILNTIKETSEYSNNNATLTSLRNWGFIKRDNNLTDIASKYLKGDVTIRYFFANTILMRVSNKNDLGNIKNTLFEILNDIRENELRDIKDIANLPKYVDKDIKSLDILQSVIPFAFPNIIIRNGNRIQLSESGEMLYSFLENKFLPWWKEEINGITDKKDLPAFYSKEFPKKLLPNFIFTNKSKPKYQTHPNRMEILKEYLFTNNSKEEIEIKYTGGHPNCAYISGIVNFNRIDHDNKNRVIGNAFAFCANRMLSKHGVSGMVVLDETLYIDGNFQITVPSEEDAKMRLDKYVDKTKNISAMDQLVESYRAIFKNSLGIWVGESNKKIEGYTSVDGRTFPVTEKAHIFSVEFAKEREEYLPSIADPSNGLILEPNIHKLFDKKYIKLSINGTFYDKNMNKIFELRKEEMERIDIEYIRLYQEHVLKEKEF